MSVLYSTSTTNLLTSSIKVQMDGKNNKCVRKRNVIRLETHPLEVLGTKFADRVVVIYFQQFSMQAAVRAIIFFKSEGLAEYYLQAF